MTPTHILNLETDHCETQLVDRDKVVRAAHAMPESNDLHALVDAFRVLSNLTRLKIIHALTSEELCVCDIAALLDVKESAVSRELRTLRTMHLVKHRRAGKCVYYTLDDDHVRQIFAAGLDHVCEQRST
jgi:DNA-binding transcriptional ArsR family regulator